jgi:hypothetical protein
LRRAVLRTLRIPALRRRLLPGLLVDPGLLIDVLVPDLLCWLTPGVPAGGGWRGRPHDSVRGEPLLSLGIVGR